MDVVARGGLTAAPFALSPRHHLLAVGMASSAAARGGAVESGASRLEVLRLLGRSGDHQMGETLQVECVLQAPGLRRVAWSAAARPIELDDGIELIPIEKDLYPAGLIAGGFDDGTVRIWNPAPALICDLEKFSVPDKPKAVLKLIEEAQISTTVSQMYSAIENITWTYPEEKELSQQKDEEDSEWRLIDDDAESMGWDLITEVDTLVDYHERTQMKLLTETHDLSGPVLGLSFSELNPDWIAAAGKSDSICVHNVHHPVQLSNTKHVFREADSVNNSYITCLKWSKISPTILASSGDAGCTKIWDLRAAPKSQCLTAFTVHNKMCSSDLEFSWNNPMHVAVSTHASATIEIWDMRKLLKPFHTYASGDSGVVSLSWNRLGQLLASCTNGAINCYDIYEQKLVHEKDLPHCNLGLTWTHSENVAATLSSKNGVKLCEIGG